MANATKLDAANQLIEILRECRQRHDELHRHLINARSRLRAALDDRLSRAPRTVRRFDLGHDLLAPYLARTTAKTAVAADRMLATVGGLPYRWWPSLATLTDEMCAPAKPPTLGEEYHSPEIDTEERPEWWEPYERTADTVLDGIDEPTRLSQLLARVDSLASEVVDDEGHYLAPNPLAAALVHAAHRAWAARLAGRSVGDRVVVGVTTGTEIHSEVVRSDDLLLVPGAVTSDIDELTQVSTLHRPGMGSSSRRGNIPFCASPPPT